jgi:hypothetical protein
VLHILSRGACRSIPLLFESQIYVAGAIDVLHLLSIELVLLNVVCIIVERVTDAIDFATNLIFNFGLRVDLPDLSKFRPKLEVDATCDEGITTGLMHGSDPVNVELFGDGLESSRDI